MKNGNGWVVKTLTGFLWAIIFTVITTLVTNVIANDQASRTRDQILQDKIHIVEKENGQKFEIIKEQLATNQANQKWIQQSIIEIKELIKKNGR